MTTGAAERQSSFRVDDILPVILKKLESEEACTKARLYAGFYAGVGVSVLDEELPDESINPKIWKKLIAIDTKLNLILEKLVQHSEGFSQAENRQVSVSDEDIRVITPEVFSLNDLLEIKVLLPVNAPTWVILYGRVMDIHAASSRQNDVTIQFSEMDDDIRQVVGFYVMNRQREIVRKLRSSN